MEEYSREVEIELTQNVKRRNVDFKLKYIFLKVDEAGDFTSLSSD